MISIKLLYSFIEIALWHGILLQSCWIFRRPLPKKHLWKAASVYLEMCLLRHFEFTDRYFNLAIITWKLLPLLEAVVRRCSGVLRNFVKLTGKHLCHLFIKKETLAHGFSCEFFEIPKNTIFYSTPPVTAFGVPKWNINLTKKQLKKSIQNTSRMQEFNVFRIKTSKMKLYAKIVNGWKLHLMCWPWMDLPDMFRKFKQ